VIDDSINSHTLKTFVLTKVVPNIRQRLPESTAIVLGKAVLWLVSSSVTCDFVAEEYCDRVKRDLADTGMVTIVDGQNPILKVPIIVNGNQGTVFIAEIPRPPDIVDGTTTASGDNDGGERHQQQGGRISDDATRSGTTALNMQILQNHRVGDDALQTWMLQLQSGFMSLRRENLELQSEISSLMLSLERGFQIVNGNVRKVALQPVRTRGATATLTTTAGDPSPAIREEAAADTVAAGERALLAPALAMTNPATLMPNPKSLFDLWTEHLHRIGGESLQGYSPKPSEGGSSTSSPGGR
jgi:hypothetical protein